MCINRSRLPRRCVLFLKDEKDKLLLQPETYLFGEWVGQTNTVFLTPYLPPCGSFSTIGVYGKHTENKERCQELWTVWPKGKSLVAKRFVNIEDIELPVELIYSTDTYARTPFSPLEMEILWNKKVTIIGNGTGGAKIALELARAGIGCIKLCDPEKIDFSNISRHEGDLFDAGKPKTQVLAERIYRINPAIYIETYAEDIFKQPLKKVKKILNSDLVVAATDKTSIQLLINELTHKSGIACVFGGCYEEARGGEVFYTLPGEKMPCLACLRADLKQPKKSAKIDYSTATGPEDYQGEPGLHAAIDFITCLEIQICLAILLHKVPTSRLAKLIDPRFNFILVGGALASGFYRFKKPFDIFFQPLKGPRKNCVACGDSGWLLQDMINPPSNTKDSRTNLKKEDK